MPEGYGRYAWTCLKGDFKMKRKEVSTLFGRGYLFNNLEVLTVLLIM